MTRKIISVVLSLCMILSCFAIGGISASAASASDSTSASAGDAAGDQYAQATIGGSNVLHCFNWTYNNIKNNLSAIKAAGYTAVQTSPVQKPKDYSSSYTDMSGQWWKMYQPLGLSIAANGTTWLGTSAELTSLCTTAESYGIKIIVDIVANHLANNGSDGGGFSYVNTGVDSDLYKSQYFHSSNTKVSYDSRYAITQYHLGMPDLNTGNTYIQNQVLQLLKDCVDCGVDGFRFDAAKHIETPTDDSSFSSNFWPNVINGIKGYKSDVFVYGEILGEAGPNFGIDNYTRFMAVTDDGTSSDATNGVRYSSASDLADPNYTKGASAEDSVLWVESHDTYMHGETNSMTSTQITRTWAITGARANSTGLFLARPNSTMGAVSSDTTWKSTAVAEINKFKNFFNGTNEYLASSGSVAYIERGTQGVVISKLNGSGSVSLTAHQMAAGTYKDQISGNTFTVSNGTISGTVGSTGVAVVYNTTDVVTTNPTASNENYTVYFKPNSNWLSDGARFAAYIWNGSGDTWYNLTEVGDGYYKVTIPGNYSNIIFCRMNGSNSTNSWDNKWNQTGDLTAQSGKCYVMRTGSWDTGDWTSYTEPTTAAGTTAATTAAPTTANTNTLANGFYLIGPDWSVADIDENNKFVANPNAQGEYMLTTTLAAGDKIKVVKVESGAITAWYPDGMDNEYTVTAATAGETTIYFKETYNSDWADFGGYMWMASNEPETTAAPTTAVSTTAAPTTAAPTTVHENELEDGYYLITSPWSSVDAADKFSINTAAEGTEYYLDTTLTVNEPIKVVKVENDAITAWYPDGMDNEYVVDADHDGNVTIYFRTDELGAWSEFGGYFYIAAEEDETTIVSTTAAPTTAAPTTVHENELEDGYYLITSPWSSVDAADKFSINTAAEGTEYYLETTLTENEPIKVVKVENDAITAWYPDGMDNEYVVDADHDGNVTIYFRTDEQGAWSEFGGYIYIAAEEDETTAEPTTVAPTTVAPDKDFYLFGYINGADYACEEDAANLGNYKFVNGTLTATFTETSYVAVKDNQDGWFMANGYPGDGVTTATLYSTAVTGENSDKLQVPGGVAVTFTLIDNGNGSYTLSYATETEPSTTEAPTTIEPTTESNTLADGYYLIGIIGWTVSDIDPTQKFELNTEAEGVEYMLSATLSEGDSVKVVKVESGAITAWYPEGMGNEYIVDTDHAGNVMIYFRTDVQSSWSDFGGYIYIATEEPATEEPTTAPEIPDEVTISFVAPNNSYSAFKWNGVSFIWGKSGSLTSVDMTASDSFYAGDMTEGLAAIAKSGEWTVYTATITKAYYDAIDNASLAYFQSANGRNSTAKTSGKNVLKAGVNEYDSAYSGAKTSIAALDGYTFIVKDSLSATSPYTSQAGYWTSGYTTVKFAAPIADTQRSTWDAVDFCYGANANTSTDIAMVNTKETTKITDVGNMTTLKAGRWYIYAITLDAAQTEAANGSAYVGFKKPNADNKTAASKNVLKAYTNNFVGTYGEYASTARTLQELEGQVFVVKAKATASSLLNFNGEWETEEVYAAHNDETVTIYFAAPIGADGTSASWDTGVQLYYNTNTDYKSATKLNMTPVNTTMAVTTTLPTLKSGNWAVYAIELDAETISTIDSVNYVGFIKTGTYNRTSILYTKNITKASTTEDHTYSTKKQTIEAFDGMTFVIDSCADAKNERTSYLGYWK